MSAMPIALLLTTAAVGAVGVAVLRTLLVLRRQVAALHTELAEGRAAAVRALVPAARSHTDADEIRAATTVNVIRSTVIHSAEAPLGCFDSIGCESVWLKVMSLYHSALECRALA